MLKLEICASSMNSVLAARDGGADRIELCNNMAVGGTTPSYDIIKSSKKLLNIPVFPIIRPRGGNFIYSDEEFEVMKQDIICCAELDCQGVVLGILDRNGNIDLKRCSELIALARPMQVTFHRAFDSCNDLEKGLEAIINLGFDRVLTSGGMNYAFDGIQKLMSLVQQADSRISIMPGSGINPQNLAELIRETGAHEFHSTAKKQLSSNADPKGRDEIYFDSIYETDIENVSKMRRILDDPGLQTG